ncbi:MAG: magnesium transporter [Hadesarchaea archaeon]|nr:magnesium transporter [Hadesarchaea archaeon]
MPTYSVRRIVFESYPILFICVLIGLFAGVTLQGSLGRIGGTLVMMMVPLLNGIGGNLGSILGARLGSALHLGMVEPKLKGKVLGGNVNASVLTGIGIFSLISAIFFAIAYMWGIGFIGAVKHALVFILAGMLLIPVIIASTVASAFISFRKGLDPDNVVIPIVTSIIDVAAAVCLLIIAVNIVGV